MNYWLIKTEPDVYSFEDLVKEKRTAWTGVRNYAARNNLQAMKKGDLVLVYYSMTKEKAIVAIAKVVKVAYQDPTTDEAAWVCVDVAPVKKLIEPVALTDVKVVKELQDMALVRLGRLSVQPVTAAEWKQVLKMGKTTV